VGNLIKASAVIHLRLTSEKKAEVLWRSLRPETESSPTYRSKVQVERKEEIFKIIFESTDTTALRASINSYLSWLQLLNSVYDLLESERF